MLRPISPGTEDFSTDKLALHSAFILITLICLTHLFCVLSFLTSPGFLPFALPLAIILAIVLFLNWKETSRTSRKQKFFSVGTSLLVFFFSLAISAFYFDLSWDGQWYHQAAIYHLAEGWNPLLEPIRIFDKNNDISIIHFPKASWYFAAAVFSTFGNFEAGKCINFIVLFIALFTLYSAGRSFHLSAFRSAGLATLVVLNPVVWSEITTFLVDGLLFLYLCIYLACLIVCLKQFRLVYCLVGAMAVICLINIKFTGMVFFCTFALCGLLYTLLTRKSRGRFILLHALVTIVAVTAFGFNPYVTNTAERGHPLYPIFGSKEYPDVYTQTGEDANELYETPHNMMGKPLGLRLFYANFGRPDNAPYAKAENAELIWPLSSRISDWEAYRFHETRVAGFGPWFSAILIGALVLLIWLGLLNKKHRWPLILSLAAVCCSILYSKHLWWPRFGPQMWLIPLIPLAFCLAQPLSRKAGTALKLFGLLIAANGVIVLFIHMQWETSSSLKLRQQLSEIRKTHKPIEIYVGWFEKSMHEKLNAWHIEYRKVKKREITKGGHHELVSVVDGYPNMILYRKVE